MTNIEALERVGELASARLSAATARSPEARERWERRAANLESDIDLRPGHTVVVVVEGPKDSFGRQRFTTYWWGYIPGIGDGVRAQGSHAVVAEHVARWRARGDVVTVCDEAGRQP